MILLNEDDIKLIAGVANAVRDLLECNCGYEINRPEETLAESPVCGGDCTYAEAKQVLDLLARKDDRQNSPQATAYREAAHAETKDGELEVDEGAIVSFGDDPGAYVMAWIWVANVDAGICRECGEPNADNGEGWDGLCGNCADKAEKHEAAD